MHLTKHAVALDKNVHIGLQLRFYIKRFAKGTQNCTFSKIFLLQLPMKAIQHNTVNDMKGLATEPGVFYHSAPEGVPSPALRRPPLDVLRTEIRPVGALAGVEAPP